MARPKKYDFGPELYEDRTEAEIKDAVVRNLKQIYSLKHDLKQYASGVNDTIKELEARNDAALEALEEKELKS